MKPQQYRDELREIGDVIISRSPRWAIRLLGVFFIAIGIGVFYLSLNASR
jgi:uncharacterized protein YjeT (DUF2065 family)